VPFLSWVPSIAGPSELVFGDPVKSFANETSAACDEDDVSLARHVVVVVVVVGLGSFSKLL
jgi:hypothetical protein